MGEWQTSLKQNNDLCRHATYKLVSQPINESVNQGVRATQSNDLQGRTIIQAINQSIQSVSQFSQMKSNQGYQMHPIKSMYM